MAYTLNDSPITYGTPFKSGDLRYTKAWWSISSDSEKTAVGIKTVADPTPYDERFYWSSSRPKDINTLKSIWIQAQKDTANTLLAPTDWMIVRQAEGGASAPSDTKTYRAAVRTKSKEREDQITACSDTAALAALVTANAELREAGTASNGAEEKKNSDGDSYDPKQYESIMVVNPAALKAWPEKD